MVMKWRLERAKEDGVLSGFAPQSDKNVSRETFWYDSKLKPYKPAYSVQA
jgi:hypothetical protein